MRIAKGVQVGRRASSNHCDETCQGNENKIGHSCSVEYVNLETGKKIEPSSSSESSNLSFPDGREGVQFQKKPQFSKSHQPIQLTWETSSSSSSQNSLRGKVNEGELSLPVYSFMEYGDAPAVVYTKSESEANSLVQTLQG